MKLHPIDSKTLSHECVRLAEILRKHSLMLTASQLGILVSKMRGFESPLDMLGRYGRTSNYSVASVTLHEQIETMLVIDEYLRENAPDQPVSAQISHKIAEDWFKAFKLEGTIAPDLLTRNNLYIDDASGAYAKLLSHYPLHIGARRGGIICVCEDTADYLHDIVSRHLPDYKDNISFVRMALSGHHYANNIPGVKTLFPFYGDNETEMTNYLMGAFSVDYNSKCFGVGVYDGMVRHYLSKLVDAIIEDPNKNETTSALEILHSINLNEICTGMHLDGFDKPRDVQPGNVDEKATFSQKLIDASLDFVQRYIKHNGTKIEDFDIHWRQFSLLALTTVWIGIKDITESLQAAVDNGLVKMNFIALENEFFDDERLIIAIQPAHNYWYSDQPGKANAVQVKGSLSSLRALISESLGSSVSSVEDGPVCITQSGVIFFEETEYYYAPTLAQASVNGYFCGMGVTADYGLGFSDASLFMRQIQHCLYSVFITANNRHATKDLRKYFIERDFISDKALAEQGTGFFARQADGVPYSAHRVMASF